jgi:DNA gyrase/topoisomerase IV subunit B
MRASTGEKSVRVKTTIYVDHRDLATVAIRALVLYSLAEFQGGHASTINVIAEGMSFSVADDGRGHAIARSIAGRPYLAFIYTHLDYPFADAELGQAGQVQLQGIGMSLLNALCSELSVTVRKREGTLHLSYDAGRLASETRDEIANNSTGTSIAGTINSLLQPTQVDVRGVERWLLRVVAIHPKLKLHFNGKDLSIP